MRFNASTSIGKRNNGLWQSIWKLNTPNSVKMYIRKACRDVIPTFSNLCKMRVIEDDKCPFYKVYTKTVGMLYGIV